MQESLFNVSFYLILRIFDQLAHPMKSSIFTSIHTLLFVFVLWAINPQDATAQERAKIDSLRIAYDYSENPLERVYIQIEIGEMYYRLHSIDTAIFELRKAVGIIPPDSLELKGKTLNRLGDAYRKIEKMDKVVEAYKAANDMYVQSDAAPKDVAWSYAVLGRAYYAQAKYDTAMTYYMDAKEIFEKNNVVHDNYGNLLHFIGSVFKRQGDYESACKYYYEEIEYGKKHDMKHIEVEGMYLAGICIEDDRERLQNDFACLEIYKEIGSSSAVALMYQLIGGGYHTLDMLDSALYYQKLSLDMRRENKDITHLASTLTSISSTLIDMGKYGEAKKYLEEAEEVAFNTGIKKYIRLEDIYSQYFDLTYNQGRYKDAVEYQYLMYAYRDSAMDQEHQDAILEMEKIYNDEKQKTEMAILQKNNEISKQESLRAREEAEAQSFIKKLFMAGGLLVLVLGVFVFLKYRESQKQKLIISEQKSEMEFQKDLVEAKNKDITDSMVYASSIQQAIITSEDYIRQMFPDFFVFYRPRDIVSGDFYWGLETDSGKKLIAVGDCTGHGVPGAMMSMLGTAFLNEIVIEKKILEPHQILDNLRDQVKKSLKGKQRNDGMDMCFCAIEGNKMKFSGANLPVYILRKGELIQLKGDKQPIGFQPVGETPFTQQEFILQKEDVIYLFSDGYADQFGGPKGKKFKYKTFRERIADISVLPIPEQLNILDTEFETWKGDLEQLDDVCVLGIRV